MSFEEGEGGGSGGKDEVEERESGIKMKWSGDSSWERRASDGPWPTPAPSTVRSAFELVPLR
jgi:hypothetical protein